MSGLLTSVTTLHACLATFYSVALQPWLSVCHWKYDVFRKYFRRREDNKVHWARTFTYNPYKGTKHIRLIKLQNDEFKSFLIDSSCHWKSDVSSTSWMNNFVHAYQSMKHVRPEKMSSKILQQVNKYVVLEQNIRERNPEHCWKPLVQYKPQIAWGFPWPSQPHPIWMTCT